MLFDQTMTMDEAQRQWYYETWARWHQVMKPYSGYGASDIIKPIRLPPVERFENCKVVPKREDILPDMPKRGRMAEIGTQEGLFAERIVLECNPSEMHLFDVNMAPLRQRNSAVTRSAILHEGDSSTLMEDMPENYFDMIYIDGDHTLPGVQKDIDSARSKVKPGGFLVFNDFSLWSAVEFMPYGVPYAVCNLSTDFGWNFTHFALNQLLNSDVALQRPL